MPSVLRPQQNRLLIRSFNFHAVCLDAGVILERLMNNPAVESAERFQLDHITPTTYFFSGVLGLLNQGFAGLGAVAAHVHHYLWG